MPTLRRITRRLKREAVNSLSSGIEFFNRPHEEGRQKAVLFFLQHAFEMLLKAKIWQERHRLFEPGSRMSYRFDKCLGIAKSDLQLINDAEALTLATLDGFRNCSMHYFLTLSEDHLYLYAQAAVTLFKEILERAFGEQLGSHLAKRVLPISTSPPQDLDLFLDREFVEILALIQPGRRQYYEASARLHGMLIMESNIQGEGQQPTDKEVSTAVTRLRSGKNWRDVFPGVASLRLASEGSGLTFSVRITKGEGPPFHVLKDWEKAEGTTLVREVDSSSRYNMNLTQLRSHLGLTQEKALALIYYTGIQNDPECFKIFSSGKSRFKHYSQKALVKLEEAQSKGNPEQVWQAYRDRPTRQKKGNKNSAQA